MSSEMDVLSRFERMTADLDESQLLDVVVSLAARVRGLEGEQEEIRGLLHRLRSRNSVVSAIGGGPQRCLGEIERSLTEQIVIQGEARASIWSREMFESRAAAAALGAKPTNREKVRRYRERSWIIALPHGQRKLYPAFQFDLNRREVFPVVRAVNELLVARDDPWGVASWWVSRNARLGAAPAELVATGRSDDLVAAAEAVIEPVG